MAGRALVLVFCFCALLAQNSFASTPRELSIRLFRRLTGTPISLSDPRLSQMETLIAAGDFKSAAAIATEDPNFYRLTVKQWATRLSNKDESPFPALNDFSAMVVGVTRDDKDARLLLTGDFAYEGSATVKREVGNNLHYERLEANRTDLKADLKLVRPQWAGFMSSAGLLTTRAWGSAHYRDGTNRRAVEFSIREFLCTPITSWKETGIAPTYVRRDVDRAPGGSFATFQKECRTCHDSMDAMGGAFAHFDFKGEKLIDYRHGIAPKMNQNEHVYDRGRVTKNDYWMTPNSSNHQALFGWRGPTSGLGIKAFGRLIADSERFKSCMAERAFREICGRDANSSEKEKQIAEVAEKFESGGYKLRSLFQDVAVLPGCLNDEGSVEAGVGNFRQIYEALIANTGVDPLKKVELQKYYDEAVTRLPRSGTVEDLNSTSLLAITALSGMFCNAWISDEAALPAESRKAHAAIDFEKPIGAEAWKTLSNQYALRFWQREAEPQELEVLEAMGKEFNDLEKQQPLSTKDRLITLCTAMTSSLEAMSR